MGSVFKKDFTKPLPAGAEVIMRNQQPMARWKDRRGKTKMAPLVVSNDGTQRMRIESSKYIAKYRDGNGLVREVATGCRDKTAALAVLADLEKRAELIRSGVLSNDEAKVADARTELIQHHIEVFLNSMVAKGLSKSHRVNTEGRLRRVVRECSFVRLSDISRDTFERWLVTQQTGNMSARTRNTHLQAIRSFCGWCVETSRLSIDPLRQVAKASEKEDRRLVRRSMTADELQRLLYVARNRRLAEYGVATVQKDEESTKRSNWTREKLTFANIENAVAIAKERLKDSPKFIEKLQHEGRERALIYKVLVLTGLRRGELRSITLGQVHLDCDAPYLELAAADEKNRQGTSIPLRGDLASDLRDWLKDRRLRSAKVLSVVNVAPASEKLFSVPDSLLRALNRDLEAAGIAKKDERGRSLDLHALRTSFGTLLSAGGVTPRTAQEAMRHSDIKLTMGAYCDPALLDVSSAMDKLPDLYLDGVPTAAQVSATGTTGSGRKLAPMLAPTSDFWGQIGSIPVQSEEKSALTERAKRGEKTREKSTFSKYPRRDSNLQPSASEADASQFQTLTQTQVMPTEDSACSNACTGNSKIANPTETTNVRLANGSDIVNQLGEIILSLSEADRGKLAALLLAKAKS